MEQGSGRSPGRLQLENMVDFGTPPLEYYVNPIPNGTIINEKDSDKIYDERKTDNNNKSAAELNTNRNYNNAKPFTLSGNLVPDTKIQQPY